MLDDKTGVVVEANDIEATKKAINGYLRGKKRCNERNISLRIQKILI